MSSISFLDPPEIFDCSVTPIPGSGSSPLQVIASLWVETYILLICDGIGDYVGIYSGAPGAETLKAVSCGGSNYEVKAFLPKGSRISVRAMGVSAINTGTLCLKFYGQSPS